MVINDFIKREGKSDIKRVSLGTFVGLVAKTLEGIAYLRTTSTGGGSANSMDNIIKV
jgi:hypothetical protein